MAQKTVYNFILRARTPLSQLLAPRLHRWERIGLPPRRAQAILDQARRLLPFFPPRARWVFVRMVCNGWFTERRFQKDRPCRYCRQHDPSAVPPLQDSLEHFFSCPAIRSALGPAFQSLCIDHFFLLHPDDTYCKGMVCILYSLYTWHNGLRHTPGLRFQRKGFWRLVYEIAHTLKPKFPFEQFKCAGPYWRTGPGPPIRSGP